MVAQVTHHAPSRRFIKGYLMTWGLLAMGGLLYLASLAWHPELQSASRQPPVDPEQPLRVANRALVEVSNVRRTVTDVQRDVSQLKEAVEQHEAQDRASQLRLSALEERVTTMTSPPPAPVAAAPGPAPTAKSKTAKAANTAEPRPPIRVISVVETPTAGAGPVVTQQEAPKLETGSIAASPTISFGEAEVTPARDAFAVQLGVGPSLDALRLSWSLLIGRHGAALASLEPRFVAPRNEGGPYRLVAGPLPSKADADRVCADMGVGRQGCFSTTFVGEPL